MVNVDQSMVNMDRSQTGFGLGRSGPGRAGTWRAAALPRHGLGPPLGCGLRLWAWAWLMVDQDASVHGPRLLPVNHVHPSILLSMVYVYWVQTHAASEGRTLLPSPACSHQ